MIIKEFELNKFPTHVSLTKTKLFKISTQGIYNSKLHYQSRSKVIETMKDFVRFSINHETSVSPEFFPLKMHLSFYVPSNWGTVRMSKGALRWIPAKPEYKPTFDLDNMSWVWGKVIQDCLTDKKIIPDDTVEYINSITYDYIPIHDLNDRKINIKLIKNETSTY